MADPDIRSAARLAALVAVPLAVLAGIGVFAVLSGALDREPVPPAQTPTAPAATGPVEMAAPELTERAGIVCRALLSQLPGDLDGLAARPVTAGPEQNAAYGDPPVTLACGVPPADYALTDTVYPLSGVCWHAAEGPDATIWTTLDREVPVRVTVPAGYDGPAQRVVPLATAVAESVRSVSEVPSGCSG